MVGDGDEECIEPAGVCIPCYLRSGASLASLEERDYLPRAKDMNEILKFLFRPFVRMIPLFFIYWDAFLTLSYSRFSII